MEVVNKVLNGRMRCAADGEWSRWDGYLPVVEDRQSKGLALRVRAQVRLKAKRVDGRDEGLDGVERRAWDGSVLGDVTPAHNAARLLSERFLQKQWRSIIIINMLLHMNLALCSKSSAKKDGQCPL